MANCVNVFIITICLLMLLFGVFAHNTEHLQAIIGYTYNFTCTVDQNMSLRLNFKDSETGTNTVLFLSRKQQQSSHISSELQINGNATNYVFVVSNVTVDRYGEYYCVDDTSGEVVKSFVLKEFKETGSSSRPYIDVDLTSSLSSTPSLQTYSAALPWATGCLVVVALVVTTVVVWCSLKRRKRCTGVKQMRPDVVPAVPAASTGPAMYAEVKRRDLRQQATVVYSVVNPRHNRTEGDDRSSDYVPTVPVKLPVTGAAIMADDNCGDFPTYAELAVTRNKPTSRNACASTVQQKPDPVYADISHLDADTAAARAPLIPQRQKAVYANYDDVKLSA